MVGPADEVMLVTDRGQTLRTKVSEIRETGRNAQGVRLMDVEDGERVVAIEAFAETEAEVTEVAEAEEGAPPAGDGQPPAAEEQTNGVNEPNEPN
jgi:DNA gyrase subunit A